MIAAEIQTRSPAVGVDGAMGPKGMRAAVDEEEESVPMVATVADV